MLGTLWSAALSKRDSDTVSQFFCEYCEICKNTFFTEHFQWLLLPWSRVAECLVFDTTTVQSYKIHRSALKPDVTFTKLLWPEVTMQAQETKRLIWFLTKLKFNKELLSDSRVKGTKPAYTGYFLIFFSIFWSFHHMVLCSTIWSADWEKNAFTNQLGCCCTRKWDATFLWRRTLKG